ncbi:MAG: DUF2163 domain-containing protein [Hyphomonas sp.]|jgi:hypothetical protein
MQPVSDEFAEALKSGATTTCLCWTLTRADGFVLRMTEHDRALTVDGHVYDPDGQIEGLQFSRSRSLAPGPAEARGALAHAAITEADLDAGLWDGAQIDVIRADWQTPEHFVKVWSGRMTRLRRNGSAFEAELVSQKADLERPVGRVYARRCDAVLGDARCGVDREGFPGLACDHRFETCRDVFGNTVNFRGFPHLPGTDVLVAGPPVSGNTGGRR